MNQAEDFLQVAFAAAHPFITEILHFDDRDAGFSGQAFNKESFTCTDGAAEEITLGKGSGVVLLPKLDVLAEPSLNLVQSIQIVERARRFDKFDQPAGVFLHQIFLQLNEVRRAE